jgi:hypothetical protein
MFRRLGQFLGHYLELDRSSTTPYVSQDFAALVTTIRVGDVLLVEGRAKVSTGIKYLTQSTWSHAAVCVQDASGGDVELVEVTMAEGCHRLPLTKYEGFNTRICRALSLSEDERAAVAAFAVARIGMTYDMRNIFDLLRYLLPTPPVPVRWRRRMLAFGSGDPTRAICSSLIAQAFQSVLYPILPDIKMINACSDSRRQLREVWHIRHHSLFVPRDFDLSPYFAVIKPTIKRGFDHHQIPWAPEDEAVEHDVQDAK